MLWPLVPSKKMPTPTLMNWVLNCGSSSLERLSRRYSSHMTPRFKYGLMSFVKLNLIWIAGRFVMCLGEPRCVHCPSKTWHSKNQSNSAKVSAEPPFLVCVGDCRELNFVETVFISAYFVFITPWFSIFQTIARMQQPTCCVFKPSWIVIVYNPTIFWQKLQAACP